MAPVRRLLPLALALAGGLLVLWWGLAMLERIVLDEREQAYDGIASQRAALAEYARRTLEQQLQVRLHDRSEDIEQALADPLAPTDGLVVVEHGRQRLPRLAEASSEEGQPAQALYELLRRHQMPPQLAAGSPRRRRVELYLEFRDALDGGGRDSITVAVQNLLYHRAVYILDSAFDIPLMVAMLDDLLAKRSPDPEFMEGVLRTGFGKAPGRRLDALQNLLLRRRRWFSTEDFEFLAGRIASLSRTSQVPVRQFEQAIESAARTAIPRPPRIDFPMLLDNGRYYVATHSSTQLRGVAVDLPPLSAAIEREMRRRGLLEPEDTLSLAPLTAAVPVATLPYQVEAPRLQRAEKEAEDRFWLKTTFVAGAAGLALIIVVLALLLQRRRHRFVELKSDFVATVSHELRTPLASIRLMAETLERRTRDVPAARDYPARIVRDIDELAFLVENILSFNRLDKGRWQPRRADVQLRGLVDEVMDDLEQYGIDDVQLGVDGIDDVVLHGDRELLKLLLRNLAKNACTYNERRPIELKLRGDHDGSRFTVELTDNGVGIPAAQQGRVFEDFIRVAGTRARGSGLGLSICRKTMQAHGGRIRIAHSSPEGTCFALEFPATMVRSTS
ncbi:MAG: HAMP domain-containing histidine kinase [Deltaproteobacteria bacterium]|nr:HAMP domain-containing histidine kinase [Deltaproteobacteria bacterium]